MRNFTRVLCILVICSFAGSFAHDNVKEVGPLCQPSDSPQTLSDYGVQFFHSGQFEQSFYCFELLARTHASLPFVWNNLGHVLQKLDRVEESIQAYQQAIALDETKPEPWLNLGYVFFQEKEFEKALDYFQHSAQHMTDVTAELWNNIGTCLLELRRFEESIPYFRNSLTVLPSYTVAVNNLAQAYRQRMIETAESAGTVAERYESDAERVERFRFIYNAHLWNVNDTADASIINDPNTPRSGFGSHISYAANAIAALEDVIHDFGIKSMIDAPCGELSWMLHTNLQQAYYYGLDIVPEAVERNQHMLSHRTDQYQFLVADIVKDPIPVTVDLIFCRQTMQHLHQGDVLKALHHFNRSGAKYLLMTTFLTNLQENELQLDLVHGYLHYDMLKPPFNLPLPLRLYMDIPHTSEYLALWELPLW